MANRLKSGLLSLILDKQSVFVEEGLKTDIALIAFKIYYYIKRRTRGGNRVVGLKIGVSKAYDRLEWKFIEKV